jgi:flagellin-like hook-associated protein FlgL
MIPSLSPSINLFLNGLSRLQSTITTATAQISSGYRVSQPSDAPDQISPLLQLQASLSHNGAVTGNLTLAQTDVTSADQSVSSAIQLLDQALSIGAQGASSTSTPTARATLAQQVLSIQEQMVALANTQVAGRYVFSGDQDSSQPYALQLTQPVQVGQAAPASLIQPGDTAVFDIQTTSGLSTITLQGQSGDTLQSQIDGLNSRLQNLGITASLDGTRHLQFASSNAFSVSAKATGHANLVALVPALETANNTGLNYFQYASQPPQAGGGSHVEITVGGATAIATLTNPGAPTSVDINSINDALKAQGITSVSAVLDQTSAPKISFQGTGNFLISDDSAVAGTYALDGNSTGAAFPANGVNRLLTTPVTATRQVELADRSFTTVDQTAQDLFDHRNADDSLAPDNVFAALNSLRVGLTNPNGLSDQAAQAAITAAQTSLQTASSYLNSQETFYGNTLNRIASAVTQLNTENTNLQQQISAIRDTDVVQTAVELTSAETQSQAAMAAEAKIPRTSLFDFLG